MSNKSEQNAEADDGGQRSLKKAIIIFAIVEALVMLAITLYTAYR